ncbi:hypothetical protein ACFQ7Z_17730 [Streptomyces virginiae]|uniref:HalD/BesD family halogenase n=1 Tax=Streptomyces virginiae TaxID=1961 RepID=UPI0036988472
MHVYRPRRAEVARLEKLASRRDLTMSCMGDSPRHMTVLGGRVIAEESELIPSLYRDRRLIALLARIGGIDAEPVRDPLERYVVNILHRPATHTAPTPTTTPWPWSSSPTPRPTPRTAACWSTPPHTPTLDDLDTPAVRTARHAPGDAYLLRSDTTAHRVTPLRRPGIRRSVVNLAYTTAGRQQPVTESAALLY